MFVRFAPVAAVMLATLWLSAGAFVPAFVAWVALLWFTFGTVYSVALRVSPAIVKERLSPPADRDRDRTTRRIAFPLLFAHLLLAGLSARFAWPPVVPLPAVLAGFVLMAAGLALAAWVVLANPYASSTVRVQDEREQTVITTGPYALVRHPMYLGVVLCTLGSGLALQSVAAGCLLLPLLVVFARRTLVEDRMLHNELRGYVAYAARVRSRVIPGVW